MGYTFSNIQLRRPASFSEADAPALAEALMEASGFRRVENPEEADITTVVYCPTDSPWISVYSDMLDGDTDTQLQKAKALSAFLHTDALAIGCFDSDYVYLNLLNPKENTDLWASAGSAAALGIRGARRSNYGAWKNHIVDINAFKTCMKKKRVFAEDCLYDLEPLLELSPRQSLGDAQEEREGSGVFRFYYAAPPSEENAELPALEWWCPPVAPCTPDRDNILSAVSVGGASRGLTVVFSGKYVEKDEIHFSNVRVRYYLRQDKFVEKQVELEKSRDTAGNWGYWGEIPDFRIPEKISDALPPMKRMQRQMEKRISLVFVPSGNIRKFLDITVHLIPQKNFKGQCGWTCWMHFGSKRACLAHLNRLPAGFGPTYSPDDFDLDEE